MQTSRRINPTTGQWMAVIAVVAGLLTMPRLRTRTELAFATCFIAAGPILLLASVLADTVFGIRCPRCARWSLRRLAMSSSYYGCTDCRGRFKQFGSGPWLDASGPEDAARYRGPAASRPWLGYVAPDDSSDTTTGSLLRSKKRPGRRGRAFEVPAMAWTSVFPGVSKIRPMSPAGPPIAREPGETTSGLLLRNKKHRRAS